MKNILLYLIKTHLGRIIIGCILWLLGGLFSRNGSIGDFIYKPENYNKFDFFFWVMIAGIAIVAIYFVVMMYHMVKNTIKDIN